MHTPNQASSLYWLERNKSPSKCTKIFSQPTPNSFRAALGEFIEANEKTVRLREDSVGIVKNFIDWLYTGKTTLEHEGTIYEKLHSLYEFADKICSERLCNDVMDVLRRLLVSRNHHVHDYSLLDIYKRGLGGSPLAECGLKTIVWASMRWPTKWEQIFSGQGIDSWITQPRLLLNYAKEVVIYQKSPYENPAT